MNAFEQIFDEAPSAVQLSSIAPRQKRGAAITSPGSVLSVPLPNDIQEMQAVLNVKTTSKAPAKKKKAATFSDTNKFVPSSSPIPRKGKRPAVIGGQSLIDMPDATDADVHVTPETQHVTAIGQSRVDHLLPASLVSDIDAALLHVVAGWKMRQRWHRAEKSLILQAKAICRAFCDGDKDKANEAYEACRWGEESTDQLKMALAPFLPAIDQFEYERKAIEKNLKKIAKQLPAYDWAMSVRGFGELNFVAIVGECCVRNEDGTMRGVGDYRTVSALWKRMGLGLVNGERQRRVTDAELAILHGYNPSRRSVAFNLGECLIKAGSEFKELYNERKAYELARDETIKPILAHRRAARYMTKRVLRKMYAQWRKETRGESGDTDGIILPLAAE